jgi:hypothetical protein
MISWKLSKDRQKTSFNIIWSLNLCCPKRTRFQIFAFIDVQKTAKTKSLVAALTTSSAVLNLDLCIIQN